MELLYLELDKESKFLIWLNFFLLITIVSTIIVHDLLRDYITVPIAVIIGLLIGVGAIIGTLRFLKKRKEKMK